MNKNNNSKMLWWLEYFNGNDNQSHANNLGVLVFIALTKNCWHLQFSFNSPFNQNMFYLFITCCCCFNSQLRRICQGSSGTWAPPTGRDVELHTAGPEVSGHIRAPGLTRKNHKIITDETIYKTEPVLFSASGNF